MSPSVDKINHVICGNGLKEDSTSFQNDVDEVFMQSHCAIQSSCTVPDESVIMGPIDPAETPQDDIIHMCTHSHCDVDSNNLEIASSDVIGLENADEEFPTGIKSHKCVPAHMRNTSNNIELVAQDSRDPHAVTHSNMEQTDNSLVAYQSQDQTSWNNTDLVNGLDFLVIQDGSTESVCHQGGSETCTPHSSCHFNGLPEGVGAADAITYELTATDGKVDKNGFRSEQGNFHFRHGICKSKPYRYLPVNEILKYMVRMM